MGGWPIEREERAGASPAARTKGKHHDRADLGAPGRPANATGVTYGASRRGALIAAGVLALVAVPAGAGYVRGRTGRPDGGLAAAVATNGRAPRSAPTAVQRLGHRVLSAARVVAGPMAGPYGSIREISSSAVALTFDDGPSPQWTPRILAVLRASRVKATFCLIGVNAQAYPRLVRDIVADGHTLCNHSWRHNVHLGTLSPAAIRADLARTSAAIRAAAPGASIPYFRQPGGVWTASVIAAVRRLGMEPLHWAVDPRDWSRPPVTRIESVVANGCQPGNIILLHDGGGDRSHTYVALERILPGLVRRHTFLALPTSGL